MKNIFKTLLVAITLIACDDTLDQYFTNEIQVDEAIVDLNSLNMAANGTYSFLASINHYGRSILLIPEILSDNGFIDAFNNTGRYLDYDEFNLSDNDRDADRVWNNLADIIASSSISIREANEIEFPESELSDANHYIGELHALRALALHNFQLFFAQPYNYTNDASHLGVPIPDFSLIGNKIQSPARSTTSEVYTQIVSDLSEAIKLMDPDLDNDPVRMDIHAAKALLARVYLHMENWSQAKELATEVINTSGNSLINNEQYAVIWDGLDFNDETLFTVDFNATDNIGNNSIAYFYLGYQDAFASQDFVDLFSDTDVRRSLYPLSGTLNLVQKFPDFETNTGNIQVLRISETFLIKAEAHAQLNETEEAQNTLDQIIQRADPMASSSTETGQALIDKIILERRKELAFEGFRLFDLTRYGLTYTKFRQDAPSIEVISPESRTILPIPIDEINANPNMVQNPDY